MLETAPFARATAALLIALPLAACGAARQKPSLAKASVHPAAPGKPAPLAVACQSAPLLAAGVTARGSTAHHPDLFHASCAYGAASPDVVYRLRVARPSHVVVQVAGAYD